MRQALSGQPQSYNIYRNYGDYFDTAQLPWGLSALRDFLPPWLGGSKCLDSISQAFVPMLQSLKTTTEAYMGTDETVAAILLPVPVPSQIKKSLQTAAWFVSLHQPDSFIYRYPGLIAAYGLELDERDCNGLLHPATRCYGPERLVLTVDYTGAALNALLLTQEEGVSEIHRGLYDETLGRDSLDRACAAAPNNASYDCAAALPQALLQLTALPIDGDCPATIKDHFPTQPDSEHLLSTPRIDAVVMLGEAAADPRLNNALEDILGGDFTEGVKFAGARKAVDPLFAASQGMARACFEQLNEFSCDPNDTPESRIVRGRSRWVPW